MTDPVIKEITVKADREAAFRRFTHEISTWWPTATHSVTKEECREVTIEGHSGGESVTFGRRLLIQQLEGLIRQRFDTRAADASRRVAAALALRVTTAGPARLG